MHVENKRLKVCFHVLTHIGRTTTVYTCTSIMVHLVYIKPGGVPDMLCIFHVDES